MKLVGNFFQKLLSPRYLPGKWLWAVLRLAMGWLFLWPFVDKVFGLGFATQSEQAWLAGGSPTYGFLKFGAQGPLAPFFNALAGSGLVDWLFMLGLLLIGSALILGVGVRIASYSGAVMLFLMWLAVLPPEHNPVLDEHLIYLAVLISLGLVHAGRYAGLGKWWRKTKLVRNYPWFE